MVPKHPLTCAGNILRATPIGSIIFGLSEKHPHCAWRYDRETFFPFKCKLTTVCGRYRLSRRAEAFAKYFEAECDGVGWDARYNIAPTQAVPVIRQDIKAPVRHVSLMRWGLIPYWAKEASLGARMINARAESAAEKPAFKESLQRRRCLVPADGFYEWQRIGKAKQPYCFEMLNRGPFAFAGLWDRWRAPDDTLLETCAILTTTPNELLDGVHDRMPVILPPASYKSWLDPGFQELAEVTEMLSPYDSGKMRRYAVGNRVNEVANDDSQCSEPREPPRTAQAELF